MSGSWAGTCTYPFLVIVIPATLAHVVAGKVLLGDACLEVDRGLQAVAGLEGLGDCGDGVVEVVSCFQIGSRCIPRRRCGFLPASSRPSSRRRRNLRKQVVFRVREDPNRIRSR